MRLLSAIGVVIIAGLLMGWRAWFEVVCGCAILALLVLARAAWRRRARPTQEDSALEEQADESSAGRELVVGVLIGIAWAGFTLAGVRILRQTPVYGWFTDVPGEALLREVEVLKRNRAWESIDTRLKEPLPIGVHPESKDKLNHVRYDALLRLAMAKANAESRCEASREAESFARAHGIDPQDSALSSRANCVPAQTHREIPSGTRAVPVLMTTDAHGHSVLLVMVFDGDGNTVRGLDARDFVVVTDGRAASVIGVVYEAERTEARRFAIVFDTRGVSFQRMRRVQTILGLLAGIMRFEDESELIISRNAGITRSGFARGGVPLLSVLPPADSSGPSDFPNAVRTALADLNGNAGGIILLKASPDVTNEDDFRDLTFRLIKARIPLYLIGISPDASGPGLLRQLARASSGLDIEIADQRVERVRDQLASPVTGKGAYLLTLDRRLGSVPSVGLAALTTRGLEGQ